MGWLIAAALLIFICLLPISIHFFYDAAGARVLLGIGPIRISVYPRRKSPRNKKKTDTVQTGKKSQKPTENKGGKLSDFLPLTETILELVTELQRRLVITDLQLKICMTGDDPCDLSVQYGRTWAAIGNLVPQLERLFILKKRSFDISCDYTSDSSYVLAKVILKITLCRLLWIAIFHGRHVLKRYVQIYNIRKGGTDI